MRMRTDDHPGFKDGDFVEDDDDEEVIRKALEAHRLKQSKDKAKPIGQATKSATAATPRTKSKISMQGIDFCFSFHLLASSLRHLLRSIAFLSFLRKCQLLRGNSSHPFLAI